MTNDELLRMGECSCSNCIEPAGHSGAHSWQMAKSMTPEEQGWCDFAIKLPGPESKAGYNGAQKTHAKVGVVVHSMEYESTPEWEDAKTLYNALFSDREASWTFSIVWFLNGEALFQHYPIGTVCWAQGYQGNLWLDSVELEDVWKTGGGITEGQYRLLVKTLRWVKEGHGWWHTWAIGSRQTNLAADNSLIIEHNAVPGAPATNCAVFTHGQVDPQRLLADLNQEEDDMTFTEDDRKALNTILARSRGELVKMAGRPEIYKITDDQQLIHIVGPEVLSAGREAFEDAQELPADSPVWRLEAVYPAGVPKELRPA